MGGGKNYRFQDNSLPGTWVPLVQPQTRAGKGDILGRIVLALLNSAVLKKGGGNDISKALT